MTSDAKPPRGPDAADEAPESKPSEALRRPDASGAGPRPPERGRVDEPGSLAVPPGPNAAHPTDISGRQEFFSTTGGFNPAAPTPGVFGSGEFSGATPGFNPNAPSPGVLGSGELPGATPGFNPNAPSPGVLGSGGFSGATPGFNPAAGSPGVLASGGFPGATPGINPGLEPNLPSGGDLVAAAAGGIAAAAGGTVAQVAGAVATATQIASAASGGMSLLQLADLAGTPGISAAAGAIGEAQASAAGVISNVSAAQSFAQGGMASLGGAASDPISSLAQQALGSLRGALGVQPAGLEVEVASGDTLDVRRFAVEDRLSTLFKIKLSATSQNHDISFDDVVGQRATFTLRGPLHTRTWTGLCSHLQQARAEETGVSTYELTLVPTLWLLTQRRNYRMFQQMSELDIVKKLLKEWSIEPDLKLTETYKARKYRVQYNETDFAFMCRMLEDAGITFYFQETEGETKLVLSDTPQSNPLRPQKIAFRDSTTTAPDKEHVTNVRISQRVRPGKYTIRDHDYRRPPNYKLMTTAEAPKGGLEAKLERYQYSPGAFLFRAEKGEDSPVADDKGKARTDEKEGEALARKRLEAKRATAKLCSFETNAYDLAPGVVMSMLDHPKSDLGPDRKLLILETSVSGTANGEWSQYCEAVSAEVPYRPATTTQKPTVNGVESATVVGPPGEEIHCDEFGRVRVHFHWDRESQMDENSSCWIHVSQPWGGAGFGGMNLPRVGQEVIVDFLGGDPDRPVIVGRVYTNLQKVPYKLPENKTQTGLRSNSTGGKGGYNEIMFEDAKGKELFNIQAERDLNQLVKHDATQRVKNDRTTTVWKNDSSLVGVQHSLTIAKPGGDEPSPGPTNITLVHEKITLTTGKATVTIDGPKITLDADESISLETRGKISIHAAKGIQMTSDDGDTVIKGNPKVKINCSD